MSSARVRQAILAGCVAVSWTTVVPTAITGVVGLAGIGGSILSAKLAGNTATANLLRSINAEDKRARLGEKRRIYAAALASFNEMTSAAITFRYGSDSDELGTLRTRQDNAEDGIWQSFGQLELIGCPEIVSAADKLSRAYMKYVMSPLGPDEPSPSMEDIAELNLGLVDAMRDDLGELT